MIWRCFYSSPFRSHAAWSMNPRAGIHGAMRRLAAASGGFDVLMDWGDVATWPRSCVWSPLLQGDIVRAETDAGEKEMLLWCLHVLEHGGFNALVRSNEPRAAGYGRNGQDVEEELARALRIPILTEDEAWASDDHFLD